MASSSSSQSDSMVPAPEDALLIESSPLAHGGIGLRKSDANVNDVDTGLQRTHGSSPTPEHKPLEYSGFFVSLGLFCLRHAVKILRDLLTFVVRGGLGSLTFGLDQVVSVINTALENIPGFFLLGYSLRICLWSFTLLMWIVYTVVELIFYLPPRLLILYIIALGVVFAVIPDFVSTLLDWIFTLSHTFLHLLRAHAF